MTACPRCGAIMGDWYDGDRICLHGHVEYATEPLPRLRRPGASIDRPGNYKRLKEGRKVGK